MASTGDEEKRKAPAPERRKNRPPGYGEDETERARAHDQKRWSHAQFYFIEREAIALRRQRWEEEFARAEGRAFRAPNLSPDEFLQRSQYERPPEKPEADSVLKRSRVAIEQMFGRKKDK